MTELTKEFNERIDDVQFLESIAHELSFRSTLAAKTLKQQVTDQLQRIRQTTAPPVAPRNPPSNPDIAPQPKPKPLPHPSAPAEPWPRNLLRAWIALEALSPQTFRRVEDLVDGDRKRVARLSRGLLPWENEGERSLPNKRLFYQVLLGSIRMQEASNELVSRYADSGPEFRAPIGYTPIAIVTLDKSGVPVQEDPIVISSFAWAWRPTLEGKLGSLGEWNTVEASLCEELGKKIVRTSPQGEVLPMDFDHIFEAYNFLRQRLRLDLTVVEEPQYAIRTYQFFTIADPPDPILLNSFFLRDLLLAREHVVAGKEGSALRQFVTQHTRPNRIDLLVASEALEGVVRPSAFPLGKWPAPGRYPLVMMQQAAVNLAMRELQADEAMFAVNGPPGTGKTTLLRDICAAVVLERAARLAEFDDPSRAFAPSGASIKSSGSNVGLYKVDERIRGFEIVVASMNNRAVENISRELPGIDSIAADANNLRYFKSISDHLAGEEDSTWGLISAVLGNQRNVNEFWFKGMKDPDRGLLAYLAAATGLKAVVGGRPTSEAGLDQATPQPPEVVQREHPPNGRAEALQRWRVARAAFRQAIEAVQKVTRELESLRNDCLELEKRHAELKRRVTDRDDCEHSREEVAHHERLTRHEKGRRSQELSDAKGLLAAHQASRPRWWRFLLLLSDARVWLAQHIQIRNQVRVARSAVKETAAELATIQASKQMLTSKFEATVRAADEARCRCEELDSAIKVTAAADSATPVFASTVAEAATEEARAAVHQLAPWFGKTAQLLRDSAFVAAMNLHRAFVDVAADPIRSNISAIFGLANLDTKERLPLVPHLWSTLFLVVPVVSTTFASVAKRFSLLPPRSIGWLLIDEAGQAPPQAAVGALMRAQRAVVVGDPLQIEPITSLPTKLVEAVCQHYSIEVDRWTAPNASVQTLADAACKYSSSIPQAAGTRQVGLALVVHRRCQSPMFEISNYVAYGGQMVQGTQPKTVRALLGPSCWFDVRGTSIAKWSEEEGRVMTELLTRIFSAMPGERPDIFVISAFRNVASQLKERIPAALRQNGAVEPGWWSDRIGTIHTFQGKQASIVFLVLGAADPSEAGARRWVAGTPNIVNVAASRAKDRFYVVGNFKVWENTGAMKIVQSYLRVV